MPANSVVLVQVFDSDAKMFSGLTNQVSSWMGSAKGEQEEQVPTPTEDGAGVINPDDKKERLVLIVVILHSLTVL